MILTFTGNDIQDGGRRTGVENGCSHGSAEVLRFYPSSILEYGLHKRACDLPFAPPRHTVYYSRVPGLREVSMLHLCRLLCFP